MKLTKRAAEQLRSVLGDLQRGMVYVNDPRTAIARETSITMMPEHTLTRRSDGQSFAVIAKDIGSPLCNIPSGISRLLSFIEAHEA